MLDRILARPGETLTTHTRAVVDRLADLHRLRPLPQYPRLYDRLVLAGWLHDSGKLSAAFQRGLRQPKQRWGLRHEALSLAFVDWLDLEAADRPWVLAAVATHHRDIAYMLETYRGEARARSLIEAIDERTSRAWHTWLVDQGVPLRSFTLTQSQSIVRAIHDLDQWWQEYELRGFDHPEMTEIALLRGLMLLADHSAAAGVPIGGAVAMERAALARAIGDRPYPHQAEAEASADDCVILAAPTGSGKTEAALLWATRTNVPRLFYTLPYRASMNAMQQRLTAFTPEVGLQHGRALSALYQQALEEGADDRSAQQAARARLQMARLHALPVRVFSPYHLLRLIYQFKGFEAGLADAVGAALIVDEIHAYQPGRLALILGMLRFLRQHLGARLLVMTATLPPVAARRLQSAFPDARWIRASDDTYAAFRRHRLRITDGDLADQLDPIVAAARSGQRVLVIVNTVRRALALAGVVRALGQPVIVLHGRFTARDRWHIERTLQDQFPYGGGAAGPRPLVIATQVIEVSLNLDFDQLHSDPAPVDALVQRFGRVNRSRRLTELAPVTVYTEPSGRTGAGAIYDPALVTASLGALRAADGQPIDETRISEWLEDAYRDSGQWEADYDAKARDVAQVLATMRPLESADRALQMQFTRLFDEVRALPLALEDDYHAADNPIAADSLLVSLSWSQIMMLERAGKAWRGEGDDEGLYFVDAPYDPEAGLDLYAEDEED